jgi:hypothetical protein
MRTLPLALQAACRAARRGRRNRPDSCHSFSAVRHAVKAAL